LKHLRSINFEAESLAWLPPPDMPAEIFFADETVLNLRWKKILHPLSDAFNVKYPAKHQGSATNLHFFAGQKELQIHDFGLLTFAENPRHSMYARIGLLQQDILWLKKTLWKR
jgi:hypothetical protein